MKNPLLELYTICSYCNCDMPNTDIREDGRCRWCPVAEAEPASKTYICPHGRVVSPAICRRYHED